MQNRKDRIKINWILEQNKRLKSFIQKKDIVFKEFISILEKNLGKGQYYINIAKYSLEIKKYENAYKSFKLSAEQGNELAIAYIDGLDITSLDITNDYAKLFENINPDSLFHIGNCYFKGKGTLKDEKLAFYYFESAAKFGIVDAMHSLGYCYEKGIGIETNIEFAIKYYKLAADAGNKFAQHNVARLYKFGIGVEQNIELAKTYYQFSSNSGLDKAKKRLNEIDNTSDEVIPNKRTKINENTPENNTSDDGVFNIIIESDDEEGEPILLSETK